MLEMEILVDIFSLSLNNLICCKIGNSTAEYQAS